jgi:hypothetical protein
MLQDDPSMVDRFRLARQRDMDRLFAGGLSRAGIDYVSLYQAICPSDQCRVRDEDGLPLAFDYGHLTARGSAFVARQIKLSGAF